MASPFEQMKRGIDELSLEETVELKNQILRRQMFLGYDADAGDADAIFALLAFIRDKIGSLGAAEKRKVVKRLYHFQSIYRRPTKRCAHCWSPLGE